MSDKFKFSEEERIEIEYISYDVYNLGSDHIIDRIESIIQDRGNSIEDGWIDVEDRLPDESGRYLCWVSNQNDLGLEGFVWNCCYNSFTKEWSDNLKPNHVTNWQPLPSAPKPKK